MGERRVSRRNVLATGSAVAVGSLLQPLTAVAGARIPASQASGQYPHTDPDNDGSWVLRGDFSDEFTGGQVNVGRWNTEPNSWRFWRWDSDNVQASDGRLTIRSRWNPSAEINPEVIGWPHTVTGGSVAGATGGIGHPLYVTTQYNSGGDGDLVHTSDMPYQVSNDAQVTDLPDGIYVLRARVRSSGGQGEARMSVSGFDADRSPRRDAAIRGSEGYVAYEINDIEVTSGRAMLTFYSDGQPGAWMRIRDVEFVLQGTTANLAPNPGFRQRETLDYDSGMLRSRERIKYGYFEARIKTNTAFKGGAPAFWLAYTQPCGGGKWTELDVMELVDDPDLMSDSSHIWAHPCLDGPPIHERSRWTIEEPPHEGFHIYALEWDEQQITWYADGVVLRTRETQPYFDQPLVLQISQRPEGVSADLPSTMEVDYVRVWQKEGTPPDWTNPCGCPNPWQGFTDTFDDEPVGPAPVVYQTFGDGGTIGVAESPDGAAGHALSLVRATPDSGTLHTIRLFTAINAPFRFTAKVWLSQVSVALGMSVRGDDPLARIRFSPDGALEYEEDGTLVTTSTSYQANRWHAVEISIDEDGLFNAYLDGAQFASSVPVGSADRFHEVTFGIGSQAAGSVVVDDVSIIT